MKLSAPSARQYSILAVTLLLLIVPAGLFYFLRVSTVGNYLVKRDFRQLQNIGNHLRTRLDNLNEVVASTVRSVSTADEDSARRYVAGKLALTQPLRFDTAFFESDNHAREISNGAYSEEGRRIVLRYRLRTGTGQLMAVSVFLPTDSLLTGIGAGSVFNYLRIVRPKDGTVLPSQDDGRLHLLQLKGLIGEDKKPVEFSSQTDAPRLFDITLAGTGYKLFTNPIDLSFSDTASPTGNVRWVLCGLAESDRMFKESLSINTNLVIVAIVICALVMLGWPVLNTVYIGEREPLRLAEAYFLALSAVLGVAILTIVSVDLIYSLTMHIEMKDRLAEFASQEAKLFRTDIVRAGRQLNAMTDTLRPLLRSLDTGHLSGIRNIKAKAPDDTSRRTGFRTVLSVRPDSATVLDLVPSAEGFSLPANLDSVAVLSPSWKNYPLFQRAYWVDPSGQQRVKWSTGGAGTPFVSVRDTPRFERPLRGQLWTIPSDDGSTIEAFLDYHLTKTTGDFGLTLSTRVTLDSTARRQRFWVAALDIPRPISLLKTVVSDGFGFCIVDQEGMVLFHSQRWRELSENFLEECNNDRELQTAVRGHGYGSVRTDYFGKVHNLSVAPIDGTPWSVVTFLDTELTRATNLEIIATSFVLFFLNLILIFGLFLWAYLGPDWQVRWVWPDRYSGAIYMRLILVYAFLIVVYITGVAISFFSPTYLFFAATLFPLLAVILTYIKLKGGDRIRSRKNDWRINRLLPEHLRISRSAIIAAVILAILSLLALLLLQTREIVATLIVVVVILVLLFTDLWDVGATDDPTAYRRRYVVGFALLLVAVAALPVISLFSAVSRLESEMLARRYQQSLVEEIDRRGEEITASTERKGHGYAVRRWVADSLDERNLLFPNPFDMQIARVDSLPPSLPDNDDFSRYQDYVRAWFPPFTDAAVRIHAASADPSSRANVVRMNLADSLPLALRVDKPGVPGHLLVQSKVGAFNFVRLSTVEVLLWIGVALVLALILWLVWRMAQFVSSRVFLIYFDDPADIVAIEPSLASLPDNLLMLAPPVFEFTDWCSDKSIHVLPMDSVDEHLAELRKGTLSAVTRVAMIRFEHKIGDHEHNRKKLELVLTLAIVMRKRVIVVSKIDPTIHFPLIDPTDEKRSGNAAVSVGSIAEIFRDFRKHRLNDEFHGVNDATALRFRQELDEHCPEIISIILYNECRYTDYLQRLALRLIERLSSRTWTPEQVVQLIADQARAYYNSIWDLCLDNEKLVLIQVARHRLANVKNREGIEGLLRRGLITRNPELQIINDSFRSIVLEKQTEFDVEQMEAQGEQSHWSVLRIPLIVLLVGALVFLYLIQQPAFDNLLAIITALTTVLLPAVFKLIGLFQRSKVEPGK